MTDQALHRFFGGSPVAVVIRLVVLSLVVGALLMWLDIDPMAIVDAIDRMARGLWAMGFDALREMGRYIVAGALIVVPIWFLARLFSFGRVR